MKLLDNIHYKIYYNLYFFMKNKNHSNLIFYGSKNNCKTTTVLAFFSSMFPSKLKKKQTDDYNLLLNNNYYYFNCKYIKNKQSFLIYFKEIVNTYNHYNHHIKYIILDHYEGINKILQNSLKVILEKSTLTSKIIIITNQYNNIIHPIKSRCISIRFKNNKYDKYIFFKNYFSKNNIIFNNYLLLNDCFSENFQVIKNKYEICDYCDINKKIYEEFVNLLYKPISLNTINEIKKIISIINELNIDIIDYLKRFIMEYKHITKDILEECIKMDYMIKNSYRSLIQNENLIISLNLHINNSI